MLLDLPEFVSERKAEPGPNAGTLISISIGANKQLPGKCPPNLGGSGFLSYEGSAAPNTGPRFFSQRGDNSAVR